MALHRAKCGNAIVGSALWSIRSMNIIIYIRCSLLCITCPASKENGRQPQATSYLLISSGVGTTFTLGVQNVLMNNCVIDKYTV